MKKFLSVVLSLALTFTIMPLGLLSMPVLAGETFTSGIFSYTVSNGKATVTAVDASVSGEVSVPENLGGYPVTNIGQHAFSNCEDITSIVLPESVESIGDYAFSYCTSLTEISLPQNLTNTGYRAFSHCAALKSVNLPRNLNTVASYAFEYCTALEEIILPQAVESIGYNAFYHCEKLKNVTVPSSVETIGSSAFAFCSSLVSASLPDDLTSLESSVFRECASLISVNIPEGITSIGSSAFYKCTSLGTITLPDSIMNIESYAFSYSGLVNIVIPDSLISIGNNAFSGCSKFEKVYHYCNITRDDIMIGEHNSSFSNTVWEPYHSYDPSGQCERCKENRIWSYTVSDGKATVTGMSTSIGAEIEIPSTLGGYPVTAIGEKAFYNCTSLTSVTIPHGVESIGNRAFYFCTALTSVSLPDTLKSLSSDCFSYCSKLSQITIPQCLESIGNQAFYSCTALTSVSLPDSLKTVGSNVFQNCLKLTSIEIPDSVTTLGGNTFKNCTSLISATLGRNVKSIVTGIFYNCTSLESINIPENVVYFGAYDAFYNCSGLKTVTVSEGNAVFHSKDNCVIETATNTLMLGCKNSIIPDYVTSIRGYAFYGCTSITSITIPDSVASIGSFAFKDCTALSKVYHYCNITKDDITIKEGNEIIVNAVWELIHNFDNSGECENCDAHRSLKYTVSNGEATVTGIGGAFGTNLSIPATIGGYPVTGIGADAFKNCSELKSLSLPESIVTIDSYAFKGCSNLETVTVDEKNAKYHSKDNCLIETETNTLVLGGSNAVIPDYVKIIGSASFDGRENITEIVIPDGVEKIEGFAFTSCKNLTRINIPDGVKSLGTGALWGCSALAEITLPDSLTNIDGNAFYKCSSLTEITIPDGVTEIKACAFEECTALERVTIGNGVTVIDDSAFERCTSLSDVRLGSSVESLLNSAFYGCTALINITLPDSLKLINAAFNGCTNLKTVTIGRGLSEVKGYSFNNCKSLEKVCYPCDKNIKSISIDSTISSKNESFKNAVWEPIHSYSSKTVSATCTEKGYVLHTCSNCTDSYKTDYTEPLGHRIGLDGICEKCGVGEKLKWEYELSGTNATLTAVNGINNTAIEVPSTIDGYTVTAIGTGLFENFVNLKTVVVSEGIKTLKPRAFFGCTSLASVTLPESLEEIGTNAFLGCRALSDINMPLSLKIVDRFAFEDCISLKTLVFKKNLETLEDGAFVGCTSLATVQFQHGLKTIGIRAFKDCSSLTQIEIPRGVSSVENNAFQGCTKLSKVILPEGLKNLGIYMFSDCTALNNIVIPTGVEVLGEYLFNNCTSLDNIYLPKTVKTIDKNAFKGCAKLATVYYEGTQSEWDSMSVAEGNCNFTGATLDFIHEYVASVVAPTCTEDGYTLHTCSCGDNYKTDIVSKTGHNFTSNKVLYISPATCTAEGYEIKLCDNCNQGVSLPLSAIGHNMQFTQTVAATSTAQGYDLYTCANTCGVTEKKNFVDYVADAATNRVNGVKTTASDVGVTLSWNGFSGASEYYAKVYDKDFKTCIKTITTTDTSAFFDYKLLSYNTDYKFIVTAKLRSGGYLTVANATRVDGAMVIGNRVVGLEATIEGRGAIVNFLPILNATEYLVNVFENDAQGTRIYTATLGANETSARVMNNLLAGTKYVVMINAKVGGKYMPLADLREQGFAVSFTAPVYYPTEITIAAETATSIRFNWNNVRGAKQYFIKVTEKSTGNLVNTLNVVGKTTATLARYSDGTRISPNTTYLLQFYVYVNPTTNSKVYGDPIELTTMGFESISVSASKSGNKVNLSWNSTTNAVGYYVYSYKNGIKVALTYVEGKDKTSLALAAPTASGTYTYGVVAHEKNTSGTAYTPVSISNKIVK